MSKTFPYKGYGRISVQTESDIQKVKDILQEMDDFEFGYLPDDLIAVSSLGLVPVGKFDPDLDELKKRCDAKGIEIYIMRMSASDYEDIYGDF